MIRYGDERWQDLKFATLRATADRRDSQWIDVTLTVETDASTPLPDDLIDLSIAVFCTHEGHPVQMAVLDEGCDCDYQLTDSEKAQIEAFVRSPDTQRLIARAASERE